MDTPTAIMVMPVELPVGMEPWVPYKGSTKINCPDCGNECWIGPEQRKYLDTLPVICAVCAIKNNKSLVIGRLTNKKAGHD